MEKLKIPNSTKGISAYGVVKNHLVRNTPSPTSFPFAAKGKLIKDVRKFYMISKRMYRELSS